MKPELNMVILLMTTVFVASCAQKEETPPSLAAPPSIAVTVHTNPIVIWIQIPVASEKDGWFIATNLHSRVLQLNGCKATVNHNGCGLSDGFFVDLALWITDTDSLRLISEKGGPTDKSGAFSKKELTVAINQVLEEYDWTNEVSIRAIN